MKHFGKWLFLLLIFGLLFSTGPPAFAHPNHSVQGNVFVAASDSGKDSDTSQGETALAADIVLGVVVAIVTITEDKGAMTTAFVSNSSKNMTATFPALASHLQGATWVAEVDYDLIMPTGIRLTSTTE